MTSEMGPLDLAEFAQFLDQVAVTAIKDAAEGLSAFVGEPISITPPRLQLLSLSSLPEALGGPEAVVVGIYLGFSGDSVGHVMLLLNHEDAIELIRLLMADMVDGPVGLGPVERSALGEVGNLVASLFLNSVAAVTGWSLRPTPPAVMKDMVGAILDIVAVSMGYVSDYVLVLETTFQRRERHVDALFWVIPDATALGDLSPLRPELGL